MTTVVLNTVTRKVEVFSSARDVLARAEIADHKAAADPHPQYLADADLAEVALSGDAGDLASGTVPDARMPNWTGYNLASRTALEAANVPTAVVGLRLLGHATVGDGGGAHYKRVASEPAHPHKIQSADGAWWEELFAVDVTVSIPSHFATLQDAIDRLSKQPVRRGASIILNIESGHALTAGFTVQNGDYSRFVIKSTDATVLLDPSWPDDKDVFTGTNAVMPILSCLIDAGNKGRRGFTAEHGSFGRVQSGAGIINMGIPDGAPGSTIDHGTGIRATHGSKVSAGGSIFTGAAQNAIWITRGSILIADGIAASGAGRTALFVSRGSLVHANGADFSNAGFQAVRVARSFVSVRESNMSGAGTDGINAFEGAVVAARNSTINNCTNRGVNTFQGGAIVDADLCSITGYGIDGVLASSGSKVNVENSTISGAVGATGQDLVVAGGSSIHANSATYSTKSQTENKLTGDGIIFNTAENDYPIRGTNANGHFVRHEDGTQVCWRVVPLTLSTSSPNHQEIITWPAAFVITSEPVVATASADMNATNWGSTADRSSFWGMRSLGATTGTIFGINEGGVNWVGTSGRVMYIAHGRWF